MSTTATDMQQAASKLGAFLDLFARARKILDAAAAVEQETAAAIAKRDGAVAAAGEAQKNLEQLQEKLSQAAGELAHLKDDAVTIVQSAKDEGAKIIADAMAEGVQTRESARADEALARQRAVELNARANAAERELANARQELEATVARIAAAKAEALKAIGG